MQRKPFALIGVNVGVHEPKTLKKVVVKEKLNWRSFADRGEIIRKWNSPQTPMYYVIDHKGTIRYKWAGSPGAKAIDAAIDKLLQNVKGNSKSP